MEASSDVVLGLSLVPELSEDFLPNARAFAIDAVGLGCTESTPAQFDASRLILPLRKKAERIKPVRHCHCRHSPALFGCDNGVYGNETRHSCAYIICGHQKRRRKSIGFAFGRS